MPLKNVNTKATDGGGGGKRTTSQTPKATTPKTPTPRATTPRATVPKPNAPVYGSQYGGASTRNNTNNNTYGSNYGGVVGNKSNTTTPAIKKPRQITSPGTNTQHTKEATSKGDTVQITKPYSGTSIQKSKDSLPINQPKTETTKTRADFGDDRSYEDYLLENKIDTTKGDALDYINEKARNEGVVARAYLNKMITNYKNAQDVAEVRKMADEGKLNDQWMQDINGRYNVVLDENGNEVDANKYRTDMELINSTAEDINRKIEKLNKDYTDGKIDYNTMSAEYNRLRGLWDENIANGEKLNSYQTISGFDYYDWAKQNGRDVTDFESYVENFNDSLPERLLTQWAGSWHDTINNHTFATLDTLQQMLGIDIENDKVGGFVHENANNITESGMRMREYAYAGADQFTKVGMDIVGGLEPMINEILLGAFFGSILPADSFINPNNWVSKYPFGKTATGIESFVNRNLGLSAVNQTYQQRIAEGDDNVSATVNAITHGIITMGIEGMNAGELNPVSLLIGEGGFKWATGMALIQKANPEMILQLTGMAVEEGSEEVYETLLDRLADDTQNFIANGLLGERLAVSNPTDVNPKDMASDFAVGALGAVVLSVATPNVNQNVLAQAVNTKKGYNAIMRAREHMVSVINSDISAPQEKQLAQKAIEVIDYATANFKERSKLAEAVDLPQDEVAPMPTYDEMMENLTNALHSDIKEQLESAQKTLEYAENVRSQLQDTLLDRGYIWSAEDFANMDPKRRNEYLALGKDLIDAGRKVMFVEMEDGINGYDDRNNNMTVINTNQSKTIDADLLADLDDVSFGDNINKMVKALSKIKDIQNELDNRQAQLDQILNDAEKSGIEPNANMVDALNSKIEGLKSEITALSSDADSIFTETGADWGAISTAVHEITHFAERSGNWTNLKNLVKSEMGEERFNKLVERIEAVYNALGYSNVSGEHEAVAYYIQKNYGNSEFLQKLSSYNSSTIGRFISNLKTKFSDDPRSQIENAFMRAFYDAQNSAELAGTPSYSVGSLFQAVDMTVEKETENSFVAIDKNGNKVRQLSEDDVRNTPLGRMIEESAMQGFTEDPDGQIKLMTDICNQILSTQDADLVWAISGSIGYSPARVGQSTYDEANKRAFTSFTTNSDKQYGHTFDVTTICTKTQQLINVASDVMKRLGRGLTDKEIIDIVYKEVYESGQPVPCPVCYVFSRWVGLGGVLDNIKNFQEKYRNADLNELKNRYEVLSKKVDEITEARGITGTKAREELRKDTDAVVQRQYNSLYSKNVVEMMGGEKMSATERAEFESLKKDLEVLDDWSWITNALLDVSTKNGVTTIKLNKKYLENGEVPLDILFDLNKGEDFAKYSAWKYRTTRGTPYGKTITPYTDMVLGQTVLGFASPSKIKELGNFRSEKTNPLLKDKVTKAELNKYKKAIENAKIQNLKGGSRAQSTSDFRFEYVTDYLLHFLQLQSIGSYGQTYTKVPEAVPMLASVGFGTNMSLMPKGKGYVEAKKGDPYAYYVSGFDGVKDGWYTLDCSSVTGIDPKEAFYLREQFDDAQTIMVGVNDVHNYLSRLDPRVDFIIGYHASGGKVDNYQSMMKTVSEDVNEADRDNYESTQSDSRVKTPTVAQEEAYALREKILSGKAENLSEREASVRDNSKYLSDLWSRFYEEGVDENCYHVFSNSLAEQIYPYEFWDTTSTRETADVNGQRFIEYCNELGIVPRFSNFLDVDTNGNFQNVEGYWKYLIDRPMYKVDGSYNQQKVVNLDNFRTDFLYKGKMREGLVQPPVYNEDGSVKDWGGASKDFDLSKTGEISDRVMEKYFAGGNENGIQYSAGGVNAVKNLMNSSDPVLRQRGRELLQKSIEAHEMEAEGESQMDIWYKTGWIRKKDGKWRFQFYDGAEDTIAKIDENLKEIGKVGLSSFNNSHPFIALEDVVGKDNVLFDMYPELRNTQVNFSNNQDEKTTSGYFSKAGNQIVLNLAEFGNWSDFWDEYEFSFDEDAVEEVSNTFFHELQHAIQEMEGFETGSNLAIAERDLVTDYTTKTEKKLNKLIQKYKKNSAPGTVEFKTALASYIAELNSGGDPANIKRMVTPEQFKTIESFYKVYKKAGNLNLKENEIFGRYYSNQGEIEAREEGRRAVNGLWRLSPPEADGTLKNKASKNNIKLQFSLGEGSNGYGYHYGAEKLDPNYKSERLSSRSGRGTGAFGTGTYFLGNKAETKTDTALFANGRSEHKVDFSDYNLFRPKNYGDGIELHDIFRDFDNAYRYANENSLDEYLSDLENIRNDMLAFVGEEEEDKNAPKLDLDDIDLDSDDWYEEFAVRELLYEKELREYEENKGDNPYDLLHPEDDEYKHFFNMLVDAGMPYDEAYELFQKNENDDGAVNLRDVAGDIVNYYLNHEDLYSESSVPRSIYGRKKYSKAMQKVGRLSEILGVDADSLYDTVRSAMLQSEMETHNRDFYDAFYDSVGTKIMKALGYEGIDVRNIHGLDNTAYGSVIYNLKPETIQYALGKKGSKSNKEQSDNSEYFDHGMNPAREVDIPKATEAGKTSKFWNNLANSKYASDEEAKRIEKMATDGLATYEDTSREKQNKEAGKTLKKMGMEKAFKYMMNANKMSTMSVDNALGRALLNEMRINGLENTENYHQLESRMQWRATMQGQGLEAFKGFRDSTPEGQIITIRSEVERIQEGLRERWKDKAPELKLNEDLIDKYLEAEDEETRKKLREDIALDIAMQIPPSIMEQLNSFRHMSMLFNPRTWIKNSLANKMFGYINETTRAVRSAIESIYSQSHKEFEKQAGGYNPLSSTDKANYKKAISDYNSHFGDDAETKYSTIDAGNILLDTEFGKEVSKRRKTFTAGWLNEINKFGNKMLSDYPAMSKAYAKTLVGYMKSQNITFENATEEQMEKAREFAFKEARHATFNLDNQLAKAIINYERYGDKHFGNVGSKVNRAIVESFFPFKRTPLNILKTGFDYSPIGLAKTMSYDLYRLKKNQITANQFIDNLAQGLTGTGIALLGALLSRLGIFRTKDDDNDRKKYFDKDNGEQDYSINWDGGSYTIDWADPMIIPLCVGAEASKLLDDGVQFDDFYKLCTAMAEPLFETTMLSGITNNLKSYANDSTGYTTNILAKAGTNYLSQYIPSIFGALARTVDDTRRSTTVNNGMIDKFVKTTLNKFPGLSFFNEPYINREGQVQKNEDLGLGERFGGAGSFIGRAVLNFLSPGYYSSKKIDKYDDELYRLYNATGNTDALPSSTAKDITFEKERMDFSPKEYTQWHEARWQTETKYVNEFIDSDVYKNLSDEDRVNTIKSIRGYAQKVAKKQFLESRGYIYTDNKELADSDDKYVYDKQLNEVDGALNNGINIYEYFAYKNDAGTKQAEKVSYLEDSDLTEEQKKYLFSLGGYKSTYEEAYAKAMKGSSSKGSSSSSGKKKSSSKSHKTSSSGGSKGRNISYGRGRVSTSRSNMASAPKQARVTNGNFLNAYSTSLGRSKSVSTGSSNQVVCPRCGNRVSNNTGRCPVCGARL